MESIIKFGSPILLDTDWKVWLFLLSPAVFAMLGALLCQGSFFRIVGASIGGIIRDFGLLIAVMNGWILKTNPNWTDDFSFILAFFGGSAAAIMSCCSPYRGKLLLFNSAVGGFAGQFILPFILGTPPAPSKTDEALLDILN